MKKYIITITPVLKNEPLQAVVIDVSANDMSVNYPKNAGIKVDSIMTKSGFELGVKMLHDDKHLHIRYDYSHPSDNSKAFELMKGLRLLHSNVRANLRRIPNLSKPVVWKRWLDA